MGKVNFVDQKYCQVDGSHSNQLSYDFAMEFGDLVTGARAGRVAEVVKGYADNYSDSSHFNYLFIIHEDGTVAFYAHIVNNGILVEQNDIVDAGQAIPKWVILVCLLITNLFFISEYMQAATNRR